MKQSLVTAVLKPHIEVFLVNGRHRYSALNELATESGRFGWKSDGLRVILLTMHEGSQLPFPGTSLY